MRQQLLWEDPGASAVPGCLLEVLSHTNSLSQLCICSLCFALVPTVPWGQQRRVGALSLCCRQMNGLLPHEQELPGTWDPAPAASEHSGESEDWQHPCRAPHECCCSSAWCPAVPLHCSSPGRPCVSAGTKRACFWFICVLSFAFRTGRNLESGSSSGGRSRVSRGGRRSSFPTEPRPSARRCRACDGCSGLGTGSSPR